jgi:excisionase family DNA binding protein
MRKQKDSSTVRLRSPQASLSGTILQKLSTLEDLLKKKDDKPLTFKKACAYLGYAPSYLYKLTYRKIIPHYKPTGKMIFFSKSELDEWIFSSSERRVQNAELKSEDASAASSASSEFQLNIKDPNQIEMDLTEEVVIEFPLKSRRKK